MNYKKGIKNYLKRKIYHTYIGQEKWLYKQMKAFSIPQQESGYRFETNAGKNICPLVVASHKKDLVIEKILDEGEYNFENSFFILNPYGLSHLAGLLIFVTKEECKVRYTVIGQRGSENFTTCDETYTKRHRVPIMGLFADAKNQVFVELLSRDGKVIAKKTIYIKTPRLNKKLRHCVNVTQDNGKSYWQFMALTGGRAGTYMIDEKGNIRFCFMRIPQPYGVFFLDKGRVFFPEREYRRPNHGNSHSVIGHDMDLLGRVYKTYCHYQGYHHWGSYKQNDGNILVASSTMKEDYMENMISEIDRKTGEVVRYLDLNQIFDSTHITRYDWAHINSFQYIPEEDAVVVCMRNIHTIAKINLTRNEIDWIIANPVFYKNTEQYDKVLQPKGKIKWFFQQHGVKIISDDRKGKLLILLFDNHTANRRPVKYFDKVEESNIMVFEVDENAFTVTMKKRIPVPLAITRSNGDYNIEAGRIMAACANFVPDLDGYQGKIFEFDYGTEECIKEYSIKKNFFAARPLTFDIKELSKPMNQDEEKLIVGELYGPKKLSRLPDDIVNAPMITEELKHLLTFRILGSMLQIYAKDHDLEKLYIYNDKEVMMQDYTDTEQKMEVFKNQSYFLSIPLDWMGDGEYKIALQYIGEQYRTEYWIRRIQEQGTVI